MVDVYCTPVDNWDGPFTRQRERSPFTVSRAKAMRELERELDLLGAEVAQLGMDVRRDQIRIDGWPKSGANPPPPVVITFESKVGPLRFQCDRFDHWEANLRAIGLTLQRLRLVDEGGVARSGEQYQGWNALPPTTGMAMGSGAMSIDEAARLLCEATADEIGEDPTQVDRVRAVAHSLWREASKRHHPDRGGDPEMFKRLTEARDVLVGVA